jgi:hypothetical protein
VCEGKKKGKRKGKKGRKEKERKGKERKIGGGTTGTLW